jgi:hypothetical protein
VQRSSNSKAVGNRWSTLPSGDTTRDAARAIPAPILVIPAPILVDAPTAAATFSVSERAFHSLRRRSDFPQNATVVLGPRCVRFRWEALHTYALALASTPHSEPSQLIRRNECRPQTERPNGAKARRGAAVEFGATGPPDRSPDSGSG